MLRYLLNLLAKIYKQNVTYLRNNYIESYDLERQLFDIYNELAALFKPGYENGNIFWPYSTIVIKFIFCSNSPFNIVLLKLNAYKACTNTSDFHLNLKKVRLSNNLGVLLIKKEKKTKLLNFF